MKPRDRVRVRFLRDVRIPEQSAGTAGETKELLWLNAEGIISSGHAELVLGSTTRGEVIDVGSD